MYAVVDNCMGTLLYTMVCMRGCRQCHECLVLGGGLVDDGRNGIFVIFRFIFNNFDPFQR